ncbi:protein-disulfide reductase DsbD [Pistricoccus aurantiacus]|uniref:protein-disulfide reductase DsbD n=1 Tax=Pistricoccus aurantiacus TaxID=1883414 RepID=UPI00363241EE
MLRLPRFLLAMLFLWLASITTLQAQWFSSDTQNDFLPVNEAFQATAWLDDDNLMIGMQNAEDYYLYRHRFRVESQAQEVGLGEPNLPEGEFKSDEFLGDVHVFYDRVVFSVPVQGQAVDELPIELTFQGCADAGLCYPPETLSLTALPGSPPEGFADLDAANTVLATTTADDAGAVESDVSSNTDFSMAPTSLQSEDGHFQSLLNDASPLLVLGLFLLAGLGLTFTPCVLPMIPILSSIIVGQNPSRPRAFVLSSSYVAGMAVTYALVGVLMGLFGAGLNLQARLQSAPVLILFSLLFVLFALAMFGVFNLRLSSGLSSRIDIWQSKAQRSGPVGLALAGALSVLVVSPCVSAPLAGALVFISSTGDALMGGLALLALALGMGIPLLLVGTFGTTLMPRTGQWMEGVKIAFGVLLLGVAIWLIERLLPAQLALILWAGLAVGAGLSLGALQFNTAQGWPRVRQGGGILLLVWGIVLVIGAARGAHDPLRPLAVTTSQAPNASAATDSASLAFTTVTRAEQLNVELEQAASQGQPVFVDVSADWCISCKVMENQVFPAPQVAQALAEFRRIRLDVTETNADSRALLERFGLFGPPSLLFFDGGDEIRAARIQGEIRRDPLARHLRELLDWLESGKPPRTT